MVDSKYTKSNFNFVFCKPVLRFQCFSFFGLWQTLSGQKSLPLPGARNFSIAWYANIIRKTQRSQIAAYSLSLTGNFCFKAGWVILSSNTMNQQGIGCIWTSQNQFLWFKSTRRMPVRSSRLTNLSERHWRNDWRETLFEVKISYPT